jgi:VanZ family protein
VENNSSPKWRVAVKSYAPLVLWIGVIFFLSSPEGAANQTSRIIGPILHFFYPDISPGLEDQIHAVVRKSAHFTEYAILALIAARAFASSAVVRQKRHLLALILIAVIASLDEFNQSFEPSRTSSFWDVLLDIFGGLVMTLVLMFADRRFRGR